MLWKSELFPNSQEYGTTWTSAQSHLNARRSARKGGLQNSTFPD